MTERLEARIDSALHQEAELLAAGPGFSTEDIVQEGRAAVRRRRGVAVGAVAAVAALVATGVYTALPRPDAGGSAIPPAAVSPTPPGTTDPAPSATPAGTLVTELGIPAYAGNVVVPPDRPSVTLPVSTEVVSVARVPDAWVVETVGQLWYVPDTGKAEKIGELGGVVVSEDGELLAARTAGDTNAVVAVELPSLDVIARTEFPTAHGPVPVGVDETRVLLKGTSGAGGATRAAVWDVASGTLNPTSTDRVWLWDVARDGRTLRRVDEREGDSKGNPAASACIDVVPPSPVLDMAASGLCGDEASAMHHGALSPDGAWVHLSSGNPERPGQFIVATEDLRAGRWQPVEIEPALRRPEVWDTDTTFLARAMQFDEGYYRCDVAGECEPVSFPTELGVEAAPVPVYGE